jgi:hypothetical protein
VSTLQFKSLAVDSLVRGTDSEGILDGPGRLSLSATARTPVLTKDFPEKIPATLRLLPVDVEAPITLSVTLTRSRNEGPPVQRACWLFARPLG